MNFYNYHKLFKIINIKKNNIYKKSSAKNNNKKIIKNNIKMKYNKNKKMKIIMIVKWLKKVEGVVVNYW